MGMDPEKVGYLQGGREASSARGDPELIEQRGEDPARLAR